MFVKIHFFLFSPALTPQKDMRFYGFILYSYFARPPFLERNYQQRENSLFNLKSYLK